MNKYIAEFIGTFFLVLTVGCTIIPSAAGVIAPRHHLELFTAHGGPLRGKSPLSLLETHELSLCFDHRAGAPFDAPCRLA